jgi:signal peptidase II
LSRTGNAGLAWRWFVLALLVILADQATKALVLSKFAVGEHLALTPFFNLILVYNKGAAFSFLSDASGWQKPVLAAFALGAAAIVSVFIVRRSSEKLLCTGLALILGGAIGNLVDRLRFGQVVDFLDAHAAGYHFPAFNVADSAITVGAALLILEGFVHREGRAGAST